MKYFRCIFLLLLCHMVPGTFKISAQESRAFSGETDTYPAELTALIQKNVNPESEAVLNEFLAIWVRDSLFSKAEQEKIVSVSMNLYQRNAKPYPHFSHYLSCLVTLKNRGPLSDNFKGWDTGLDLLLSQRKITLQTMDKYLLFVKQLADSSTLYRTSSVEWKISSPDFRFIIDSTIRVNVSKTDLVCNVRKDSIILFKNPGRLFPIVSNMERFRGVGNLGKSRL